MEPRGWTWHKMVWISFRLWRTVSVSLAVISWAFFFYCNRLNWKGVFDHSFLGSHHRLMGLTDGLSLAAVGAPVEDLLFRVGKWAADSPASTPPAASLVWSIPSGCFIPEWAWECCLPGNIARNWPSLVAPVKWDVCLFRMSSFKSSSAFENTPSRTTE